MKFEAQKLVEQQVDIWVCSIDCLDIESNEEVLLKLLNDDERKRYERFVFEKDKRVLLAARYLLRSLLSAYHPQIRPESWVFEFNDNGKPEVSREQLSKPIQFNLSHTRNNVALAFSTESRLGIDMESFDRDSDLAKLARYSFSEKELSQIEGLAKDEFRDRFFSLWTLKEAYMKADGRGMSLPLKSFSFIYDANNERLTELRSEHITKDENWLFWQYETNLDSFLSIAICPQEQAKKAFTVKQREVVGLGAYRNLELLLRTSTAQAG